MTAERRHRVRVGIGALAAAMMLVACGSETDPDPTEVDTAVPANARALAAIAVEHVDHEAAGVPWVVEEPGLIQVEVDFEIDGVGKERIRLQVSEQDPPEDPCPERASSCEVEETDRGDVWVVWGLEMFESDPGFVEVLYVDDDFTASLWHYGPVISADPRSMDLPISVDAMIAIVSDPRFGSLTDERLLTADVPGFDEAPS